jgi:hypothetical protein
MFATPAIRRALPTQTRVGVGEMNYKVALMDGSEASVAADHFEIKDSDLTLWPDATMEQGIRVYVSGTWTEITCVDAEFGRAPFSRDPHTPGTWR